MLDEARIRARRKKIPAVAEYVETLKVTYHRAPRFAHATCYDDSYLALKRLFNWMEAW